MFFKRMEAVGESPLKITWFRRFQTLHIVANPNQVINPTSFLLLEQKS
jgi:hypothetical protein